MKRFAKITAVLVALACALAFWSFVTTCHFWDDRIPHSEIHIDVRNAEGQPIKGATLRIYRGGTREPALGLPLHLPQSEMVSDEFGRITAIGVSLLDGGRAWDLFWIIPMGSRPPRFDCEITAPGYRAAVFDFGRLFEPPYTVDGEMMPTTQRVIDGSEAELRVFQRTFTLSR